MLEAILWIILAMLLVFIVFFGFVIWKIKKLFAMQYLVQKIIDILIDSNRTKNDKVKK